MTQILYVVLGVVAGVCGGMFGIGGGAVIDLNRLIARGEAFAARLPMLRVPQSEAVTYINGSTAILYSSEAAKPEVTTVPLVMIPRLR